MGEGLDLSSRYAVIVSFGVLLNGTALNEIAQRVGVNASSEVVLDTLVRCVSTVMSNGMRKGLDICAKAYDSKRLCS